MFSYYEWVRKLTHFFTSVSALADSRPCLTQARKAVYENLGEFRTEASCEVKLTKLR